MFDPNGALDFRAIGEPCADHVVSSFAFWLEAPFFQPRKRRITLQTQVAAVPQRPSTAGSTNLIASDWKPFHKNTLRGFFTLSLPSGLVLRNIMLHERNGKRWISLPSREYLDSSTGKKKYLPFIDFRDRDSSDRFRDKALEAVDSLLAEVRV